MRNQSVRNTEHEAGIEKWTAWVIVSMRVRIERDETVRMCKAPKRHTAPEGPLMPSLDVHIDLQSIEVESAVPNSLCQAVPIDFGGLSSGVPLRRSVSMGPEHAAEVRERRAQAALARARARAAHAVMKEQTVSSSSLNKWPSSSMPSQMNWLEKQLDEYYDELPVDRHPALSALQEWVSDVDVATGPRTLAMRGSSSGDAGAKHDGDDLQRLVVALLQQQQEWQQHADQASLVDLDGIRSTHSFAVSLLLSENSTPTLSKSYGALSGLLALTTGQMLMGLGFANQAGLVLDRDGNTPPTCGLYGRGRRHSSGHLGQPVIDVLCSVAGIGCLVIILRRSNRSMLATYPMEHALFNMPWASAPHSLSCRRVAVVMTLLAAWTVRALLVPVQVSISSVLLFRAAPGNATAIVLNSIAASCVLEADRFFYKVAVYWADRRVFEQAPGSAISSSRRSPGALDKAAFFIAIVDGISLLYTYQWDIDGNKDADDDFGMFNLLSVAMVPRATAFALVCAYLAAHNQPSGRSVVALLEGETSKCSSTPNGARCTMVRLFLVLLIASSVFAMLGVSIAVHSAMLVLVLTP